MASTISAGTTAGTAIAIAGDTSGVLQLQTNGTTPAVTIDTSQNVGIGTSSPATFGLLALAGSTTNTIVVNRSSNGTNASPVETQLIGSTFSNGTLPAGIYALNSFADNSRNWLSFKTTDSGNATAEQMRITSDGLLQFNSGYGSVATAYGCRAWVNFNGSNGAINASGNVSSVTRNGTGDYSVNFTNAMPDANYAGTGMGRRNNATQRAVLMVMNSSATYNQFTTYARFYTMLNDSATVEDPVWFNYTVFR